MGENLYEREKLYNEVWAEPVTIVAKRYGVSDVALHKICKRMNIPVPPRGYWARLRSGEKMKKTPLPAHKGPNAINGNRSENQFEKDENGKKVPLAFLDDAERQKILEACSSIEIKEQLRSPHSLIVEHREEMARRKKRDRERKRNIFGSGLYNYNYNKEEPDKNVIGLRVSDESINRAYRLMDAFIRTLEAVGCNVIVEKDGHTYVIIRAEKIKIIMKESDGLTLFLDSYDAKQKNFRDTKTKTLDSVLGNTIIELFDTSERIRIDREERERKERLRREEAERRYQRALRQEEEMEKVTSLENAAMDWHKATVIRQYIMVVETEFQNEEDEEKRSQRLEWISWAREKADWYDPTIAKEDLILGRRRHSQEDGKKVILEKSYLW